MAPPAGQSHNRRRRRRRPIDPSLAVAAVGALSATLALAFTTPLAPPYTHHDRRLGSRSVGGGRPGNSWFRPRRPQGHACCCVSRGTRLPSRGPGLPGSRSMGRRRTRQQQQAASCCLSSGVLLRAARYAAVADAAGPSAGNRPVWHLCASSRSEAVVVEQEELEVGEEERGAGAEAVQHPEGGPAADAESSSSSAAVSAGGTRTAEEGAPAKRKRRKPPAYWSSDDNLRDEVAKFWDELGVTSDKVRLARVSFLSTAGWIHAYCSWKTQRAW